VPLAEAAPFPMPAQAPEKPGAPKTPWQRILAALGVSAAFIAKFKFAALLLLSKAKLLLLGLTKMGTLLSMAASLGLYWALWGWKFALGFVLSIYVHEMGHVAMLTRLGIRATAPMFIPGIGAIVRLRENLPTAREDARVGLAGPIWGLGAAVVAYALSLAFDSPMMRAIATVGAWINLFNLARRVPGLSRAHPEAAVDRGGGGGGRAVRFVSRNSVGGAALRRDPRLGTGCCRGAGQCGAWTVCISHRRAVASGGIARNGNVRS